MFVHNYNKYDVEYRTTTTVLMLLTWERHIQNKTGLNIYAGAQPSLTLLSSVTAFHRNKILKSVNQSDVQNNDIEYRSQRPTVTEIITMKKK